MVGRTRQAVLAILLGILGCGGASSPAASATAPATAPTTAGAPMRLHFIDVGQGAATLIEFPCAAMLVDLGGETHGEIRSTDALERYLTRFFARRSDLGSTLALLAITHPHIDHTRGHRLITGEAAPFRALNVITNGQTTGSGAAQQRLLEEWAKSEARLRTVGAAEIPSSGLTDATIDPVACADIDPLIRVLWGRLDDPGLLTRGELENENNHSLVLRVDFGKGSFLVTGDLETAAIAALLERYRGTHLLDVDVYQVGHHGSDNGTSDELLRAMSPKAAVIAMGPWDREGQWTAFSYGHPRLHLFDRLVGAVETRRPEITVHVADGARSFVERRLTAGVYATGWDGDVVLELGRDGRVRAGP